MIQLSRLFPVIGLAVMLVACDYNETNFPGFDDAAKPTNVIVRTDSLTTADIKAIRDLILDSAKTAADTAAYDYIKANGWFHDVDAPADVYVPLWLADRYKYADPTSAVMVVVPQYIADEGEVQVLHQKYILDSVWYYFNAEILLEPFNSGLGAFTEYSVSGAQKWFFKPYQSSGYANASGYANSQSNANEDWLISPAMDLTKRTAAVLVFEHTINKGDTANLKTNHTLWISTDYTTGNDPATATWTQVPITTYPAGYNWTFVWTGDIPLPASVMGQSNVRFAFKYLCSDTESATWEIRNLSVMEPQE
ncbi:MAG: hypothetical protein GX619_07030 [Bacteroidales bacterium]|nr:hypothetical protein [Bacteroidales bacterium]